MAMTSNGHTFTRKPAERIAHEQLGQAVHELLNAEPEDCADVLDTVAYDIGRLVEHGFLDRSTAAGALTNACTAGGFTAEAGPDVVQEAIATGFQAGGCAARTERASTRPLTAASSSDAPDGEPDMSIVRRNQMPAPRFPLEVLGPAADWVKVTAESKAAPIDYVALGLLVTSAGLIGPKRRVSPWEGWDEPSILWGGFVGPPSSSKSPSIDGLRDAVRVVERALNVDWDGKIAKFETEKKIAEAHRAAWEQEVNVAVKSGKEPPNIPSEATEPEIPTQHRIWIVDATSEKIARLLGENRGGLICFRDELAGLLGSFDKYGGSGSDRAFWLEAYGGRSYRYDRVKLDEAVDIPFCAVSLLGVTRPSS